MATFSINIADEHVGLLISSFCGKYNYDPTIPNPIPANHPNPDYDPNKPEGPDNLPSIPPMIANPAWDKNLPEWVANHERISNPDWISHLPDPVINSKEIDNPNFDPDQPESETNLKIIPNPDFDPNKPDEYPNPASLPNPDYDPNKSDPWHNPELIPNTVYNPPKRVPNPEGPYQFTNRKVREWLNQQVRSYQSQVAAEAARKAALEVVHVDITDPN